MEHIETLIGIGLQVDTNVIIDYSKAMRDRPDRSKLFFNFDKPRLFIGGAKDPAIAYKDILTQVSQLENETTLILEKTGHMGMYEKPHDSYSAIKQFLSRVYT